MAGFGILRNHKLELFCQAIVKGKDKGEAYKDAGFKGKNALSNAYTLLRKPEVKTRIDELLTSAAHRAELSRKQILDRILDDWDTSRKLGQMASALKAGELMGRELHRMFVERKEIGGPGDFDSKSEDELRAIIREGIKDLGWEDLPPKTSELN